MILKHHEASETYVDSAGIAQCRRRFRMSLGDRLSVRVRKSGVALRLPPQSKFVAGLTCQFETFGWDLVVSVVDQRPEIGFAFKIIISYKHGLSG